MFRPSTDWTRPTCSGRPRADSAYLLKCSSLRTPSKTKPERPTQHLGPSQTDRLTHSVNIPEGSADGLGTRPQVDRGCEAYAPNCQMLPPLTWNANPSCPREGLGRCCVPEGTQMFSSDLEFKARHPFSQVVLGTRVNTATSRNVTDPAPLI